MIYFFLIRNQFFKSIQMLLSIVFVYHIFFVNIMSFTFKPQWQNQGQGARVLRIINNKFLKNLDPFLMLDFFKVRLPAGFPDHPHRGFQTVTYMIQGSFYHEDFRGHKGKIGPGDLQWMTAGKGIVHSQMPASFDEDSIGFQLWINLQGKMKMINSTYQQFTNDKIQRYVQDNVQVKIISGKWKGKQGPIFARTPSYYFDVKILPGGAFELPIPGEWNTIIFPYSGQILYQENTIVQKDHCCVLEKNKDNEIVHKFKSQKGASFVLIGGKPLGQPIQQYGPFVMNTKQQLQQAFQDYQSQKNGFQNRGNWQSKIQYMAKGKKYDEL